MRHPRQTPRGEVVPEPWTESQRLSADLGECFDLHCEEEATVEVRVQPHWRSTSIHVWRLCSLHGARTIVAWAGSCYWLQFEPVGVEPQELPFG